jgi:hypothetical protein
VTNTNAGQRSDAERSHDACISIFHGCDFSYSVRVTPLVDLLFPNATQYSLSGIALVLCNRAAFITLGTVAWALQPNSPTKTGVDG